MTMSWIWTAMVGISILSALITGQGSALAPALMEGARSGVNLAISMAGALCLWSGVGKVMEYAGFTGFLSKALAPLLTRLFPSARHDPQLSGALCANICANFLGLGNAATPMGIQAAQALARHSPEQSASNELCRLVVLNTASIQLIPTGVAAIRTAAGCASAFDILPAVWITSLLSVSAGLIAAKIFGKLWQHD